MEYRVGNILNVSVVFDLDLDFDLDSIRCGLVDQEVM
jgi:hypothetical protein